MRAGDTDFSQAEFCPCPRVSVAATGPVHALPARCAPPAHGAGLGPWVRALRTCIEYKGWEGALLLADARHLTPACSAPGAGPQAGSRVWGSPERRWEVVGSGCLGPPGSLAPLRPLACPPSGWWRPVRNHSFPRDASLRNDNYEADSIYISLLTGQSFFVMIASRPE
jgi:hypothetical protein